MKTTISSANVDHIASLSHIPITEAESKNLADGFTKVLEVVDDLFGVDTQNIQPVSQVTGLENVTRSDEVLTERMFTQEEALRNASRTHNGFFVVDQIIDK